MIGGVKHGYQWWLEPTQRKRFPDLSKMALDLLSIPAMSADPERLWSGAKITVDDRRGRLGIHKIQAIECLKSWLQIEVALEDTLEDEDIIEGRENDSSGVEGKF